MAPFKRKSLATIFVILIIALSVYKAAEYFGWGKTSPPVKTRDTVSVISTLVTAEDFATYLSGIGSVTPLFAVTVKARVDGQLQSVNFREGQSVAAGDILAQIDPAPYKAQLDLARAQKARDLTTLANANTDLERYKQLWKQDAVSQQILATQQTTVDQLKATVQADQAQIDIVQVQLDYTTLRSPIKGRTHNVQLSFDGFNSLINFQPTTQNFQNQLYAQKSSTSIDPAYHSLYLYDWTSNPFTSGLLENTLSLKTQQKLNKSITVRANFDLTLDGMLMTSNSMIRPNWQAQLGFDIHPSKWFSMELNLSRNRVAFNMDDIRYLSSDYMNADIYFWKDLNGDKKYQEGEKSSYFTSTGGKYHTTINNLKQQTYFMLDLPFYFRFGKHHEFSVLNSYRKYFNSWTTRFDKTANDYGSKQTVDDKQIYYFNTGAKPNYVVDYYPESYFNIDSPINFLVNSPFYVTNTLKYQYSNDKFLFSFAWTSYAMFGVSTLGNGPLHNSLGVYSETSANPNILYKLDGRSDPDRAYIARVLLSYNINKNLSFALTGKFKDGQPFSGYGAKTISDSNGNNQIAIWNNTNKGMNFINTDFGTRKDAFFNIDVNATYKGKISNVNFEVQLMCYNIYDFGTELAEYSFEPYDKIQRLAMELNIPRGLMLTTKIYL